MARMTMMFCPPKDSCQGEFKKSRRGVPNPNGLLSPPAWPKPLRRGEGPTLSSLWEEREKQLASGSPNLRFSPSIRFNLKAIWNQHAKGAKGANSRLSLQPLASQALVRLVGQS